MSEQKKSNNKYFRVIIFVVCLLTIIFFIIKNISAFGNVLLVMLGFGAVVLVHEFGHFIIAKLSNIKVEAFSIFMPPILFGIQRTEKGFKFRILPEIFPKEGDETGEGALSFTVGKKCKPGETEYRIGLIPFGGFVKMLGQDDIGADKNSDDPRSFANKPVHIRAAGIAAGVIFNVISAVIIFMITFLIGIELAPAKVGSVMPDSPAAKAGIKAGDEIVKIAGKYKDLDFSDIGIAAALSGKDEEVPITVKHPGSTDEEIYYLKAELMPGQQMRLFGIQQASNLTIAKLSDDDSNILYGATGLLPQDRIKSINGMDIRELWEMEDIITSTYKPEVTLAVERVGKEGQPKTIETTIPLSISAAQNTSSETSIKLSNIYSIVPRLKITDSFIVPDSLEVEAPKKGLHGKIVYLIVKLKDKITSIFQKNDEVIEIPQHPLHSGDIILAIGDIDNPTYHELTDTVQEYKDRELPVRVLRKNSDGIEQEITVTVTPKQPKGSEKVLMGILMPDLDTEHPVVANTIEIGEGQGKLDIHRGAVITAVDGKPVNNYYDIIREITKYPGEKINISWRIDEVTAGDIALNVDADAFASIAVMPSLTVNIPFESLRVPYKANGPIQAIAMGYRKTVTFIAQTYVTLRRLVTGLVSPENLMGPVGIMRISYKIVAEQPAVYYVYFLGLISAVIAVFNFLPIPPLDGGLVVLLIIEKIKGTPISEKTQTIIAYATWCMILALVIYVTFNDLTRQL